jgi:hypothetical protein
VDPFEIHAALIPQWLDAEPDVGSQELLERLIALALSAMAPNKNARCSGESEIGAWPGCSSAWSVQQTDQKPKPDQKKGCYQASFKDGNKFLMQSAPQPDCRRTGEYSVVFLRKTKVDLQGLMELPSRICVALGALAICQASMVVRQVQVAQFSSCHG